MTTEIQYAFEQYKKFYEDSALVHNGICHDRKLKEEIKHWLITRGADLAKLSVDVHDIIGKSLRRSGDYPNILKKLIGAFELLELAAVNLILFPWRKEFKTIKVSLLLNYTLPVKLSCKRIEMLYSTDIDICIMP